MTPVASQTIFWAPASTPGSRSVTNERIEWLVRSTYGGFERLSRKRNPHLSCFDAWHVHDFRPAHDPIFSSLLRCAHCNAASFEVLHHHNFTGAHNRPTCAYRELVEVYYNPTSAALFAIADCGVIHLWMD